MNPRAGTSAWVKAAALLILAVVGLQFFRLALADGSPWRRARGAHLARELVQSRLAEFSSMRAFPEDLSELRARRDQAQERELQLERRLLELTAERSGGARSSSDIELRIEDHARAAGVDIVAWSRLEAGRSPRLAQPSSSERSSQPAARIVPAGPSWSLTLRGGFGSLEGLCRVLAADTELPAVRSFVLEPDPEARSPRDLVLGLVLFDQDRPPVAAQRAPLTAYAQDDD